MEQDKELVTKAQKDIKDFDNIYQHYVVKLKNYFRPKVSNNEFEAEDLTSQTFEKALRNIKKFKWQGVSFSSWLYKIANNTLIDFYRKNKNSVEITEGIYQNLKDESKLIEDQAMDADTKQKIGLILSELPEREQKIIKLKFYDGLGNKEIAKQMKISETNVGTVLHRITLKLRDPIKNAEI